MSDLSESPQHRRISYTTTGFAPWRLLVDGLGQFRAVRRQAKDSDAVMHQGLEECRFFEHSLKRLCGVELKSLRTLEIGHGQSQLLIAYVASRQNDADGVDLDVTPSGLLDIAGYLRILKHNGAMRCLKSIAREASGVNRSLRSAFCRALGLPHWPHYRTHIADATTLKFDTGTFDLVYTTDVFEHLPDPESCLKEIVRVLKPGGALWIRSNHYGNYNAMHDLRWITNAGGAPPPPWGHLFPEQAGLVHAGAYVNQWRIGQFREIADRYCPGNKVELIAVRRPELSEALQKIRDRPEISDYSSEELLAQYVLITWRRPL